jgi:hypothetical protein
MRPISMSQHIRHDTYESIRESIQSSFEYYPTYQPTRGPRQSPGDGPSHFPTYEPIRELNQSPLDYQPAYQTAYQPIREPVQPPLEGGPSRRPAYEPKDLTIHYSKELTQLNKIYKKKDKFSGIGDNFSFKLIIFYDKCELVELLSNAYIQKTSIMLSDQAQNHYYANRETTVSFDDFCRNMTTFFESLE